MLKSVELAGFKSFAKKVSLSFTTPVTAVVGPNGSGKSNVAESFRFVLGEQSMKSMRGRRGEDLIWNGSPLVPRANRAAVKITFDNAPCAGVRPFTTVDFDEVSIERVVHRDGVNEYLLNGTSVRLKDIVELLAQAHIGASGHHIISQGEADRILSASTRERREMIEEALGLKVYHYKRIESERNLEKTEANLKEIASLRRELAPHIVFLKKQVARIEKGRELKGELVTKYQEYLRRERAHIEYEQKAVNLARVTPERELLLLDARIQELRQAITVSEESDAGSHELIALEEKLRTAREQAALLSREQGRIEGLLSAEERRLSKVISNDAAATLVPFAQVQQFTGHVGREADAIIVAHDLSIAQGAGTRIKEATQVFIATVSGASREAERRDIESEIKRIKEELTRVQERVVESNLQEQMVRDEYAHIRQQMDKEKSAGRVAERELFEAMGKRTELSITLSELKAREDRLMVDEEEYKREIAEAVVIAGREALLYERAVIQDSTGVPLSNEILAQEPREMQYERRRVLEKIKIRIEEMGGPGGDEVLKEFKDATDRDAFLAREMDDLERSAEAIRQLIADLIARLQSEFDVGLSRINTSFTELFGMMFGGGSAALSVVTIDKRRKGEMEEGDDESVSLVVDREQEVSERGIEVSVHVPHKRVRGLEMLSGGERALTSIALLFAISRVKPPPFIILDETDAALDEANSRKYGDLVAELAKTSQLILITHNRETMSRAGVLYGVTMGSDGVSRLLSIKFEEAVTVAK